MHFARNSLLILFASLLFCVAPAGAAQKHGANAKSKIAATHVTPKKKGKKSKSKTTKSAGQKIKAGKIVKVAAKIPPATQVAVAEQRVLPASSSSTDLERQPAKRIFSGLTKPASLMPRAIGSYARGCLSGAKELPVNGEDWQVMRLSRNRNWAHPDMIALLEKLATESHDADGWPGLLVGDLAQPRGGPMSSGHASHQIGLDADVWLTPMPNRILSHDERENLQATLMTKSRSELDRSHWTEGQAKLIKRAANYPQVARIFVHPPIKAELCKWATGDRSWLAKVRPYYGHNYHFHIRMACPPGFAGCKNQWTPKPSDGTGCGDELAYWLGTKPWKSQRIDPHAPKPKPVPPLTLAGLPAECRAVATAP